MTYTYTTTNIGKVPMGSIWVKDNDCSPVTFVSGDTNNNSLLDLTEAWVYHCTKTVSKTTTNIATAHGNAGGSDAYATANATVVVGSSVPPPLISIIKVPSRLTPFQFGGGAVTYTYTVTNPGVVAMHDVIVTDDKCATVSRASGDSNGDNLLDINEAWVYTCKTNVPVSTRNTATVSGKANGLIALGYAFATVLVSTPILPNTGLPPRGEYMIDDAVLKSVPTSGFRLKIPKINVDAAVESVGLTPGGAVDVPRGPSNAAWFNLSTPPGEKGTAVIDGHFGWSNDIPAVFDNLSQLQKGDKVYVQDEKGTPAGFVVREVRDYGEREDASRVFTSTDGKAHLNLITCGGTWNQTQQSYSGRVVVFTDKE